DPPFNIGYDYDVYQDKQAHGTYLDWSKQWMGEVVRVLKENGTFWLAIGDEYAAELKLIAQNDLGLTCRSWVVWYYTFGVNCKSKFTRSHAHLFHFVKDPEHYTFNENEISIPSARQLVYDDNRANPGGRLPDDTWILRPQDLPEGFAADESTWYFPRVAGTFKERSGFHGCQMPEQLLGRIIRSCSNPDEVVLDPFAGSGTTLTVANKLGRRWLGFELSPDYRKQALARVEKTVVGQPLEGAPEPVVSAPKTPGATSKIWLRTGVHRAIFEAYRVAGKGESIEKVISDPALNDRFCAECWELDLPGKKEDWNKALLSLQKLVKTKKVKKG
ncbi:MAG: site-specific DNA-methyltransferase, partial [Planctomycetes bacterium]|nr:site-specific DNA-methyltransferase [Planctomycetota bacterium]